MIPPTVLCIDDHAELLKLRKSTLESCGFHVETATCAATAMKTLASTPVATVLLDYRLDGMDAQAVAYQIKQRHPKQPIVLLSAYSDTPAPLLWLVDEYVMKSEPPERLAKVIDKVLCSASKPVSGAETRSHRYDSSAA